MCSLPNLYCQSLITKVCLHANATPGVMEAEIGRLSFKTLGLGNRFRFFLKIHTIWKYCNVMYTDADLEINMQGLTSVRTTNSNMFVAR